MYSLARAPCCAVRLSPSLSAGTVRDLPSNVSCGFLDSEMFFEKKVPNIYAKCCPSQSLSCFKAPLVHPGGHQASLLMGEHGLTVCLSFSLG